MTKLKPKLQYFIIWLNTLAVLSLILSLILYPYQIAIRIDQGKQNLFNKLSDLTSTNSPPLSYDIENHPQLWETVWSGKIQTDINFEPSPYDYQYGELQEFFIKKAESIVKERRERLNFDNQTGESLLAIRNKIRHELVFASGTKPSKSAISELSETLILQNETYSLLRVKFTNAAGLSVEGILALPLTVKNLIE